MLIKLLAGTNLILTLLLICWVFRINKSVSCKNNAVEVEQEDYNSGSYDVLDFQERIKKMKEGVEYVDGIPLYTPTETSKEGASGVEVITEEYEVAVDNRIGGRT